ncbi:Uncharacterised protein [Enterobacter cloacae]|nr:Uncharacterised protein [Enterobacter cloacae]
MLIGFQQIIGGITVTEQALNVAARHNHRVNRQRRCPGEGRGNWQDRAIVGCHFTHAGVKQFGMYALGFERLHDPQHVAGARFIIQQDSHYAAFN